MREPHRDPGATRLVHEFVDDIRHAARMFRRVPGLALTAVIVLALGIGATTILFTVINSVLLKPLAYPEPERLMTLHGSSEEAGEFWGFSNPDVTDIRASVGSLQVAAWSARGGTISAPGEPQYIESREITAGLFSVLGVPLTAGRSFRSDEDRAGAAPVAIISERLWHERFAGDAGVVGRQLVFGGTAYTVVGVAPRGIAIGGDSDLFTPLGQNRDVRMANRRARFLRVFARVRPGVTLERAQRELQVIATRLARTYPQTNAGVRMQAAPLQPDVVGTVGPVLWLLLGAVGLVLLIACVNIASLLLARATAREREFAVRAALGAGRARLIRQCLAESATLAAAGGALGALLAVVGLPTFLAWWPDDLPRAGEVAADASVWGFTLTISVVSSLVFGLVPVMRMPTGRIESSLRDGALTVASGRRRLHSAFVVAEVALAAVLVLTAGTLARSLLSLSTVEPGVNVTHVLTAHLALSPSTLSDPGRIHTAWQEVLDRTRELPGVRAAALTDIIPMRNGINPLPYSATAAVADAYKAPIALASAVTPGYLQAMGIPLRRGRFLDDHDRDGSEPVVVIDEVLAQQAFGGADPVGRQLWVPALSPKPSRIVGVAGHVRHWGAAADDASRLRQQMYYPFAQVPTRLLPLFSSFMSIAIRTDGPPSALEPALRRALRGATGDQVLYDVRTMEQVAAASLARQRFLTTLFGIFAGLAIVLACMGVYGVLAYLIGLRIPEFGVRIAMGATSRDLLALVLRHSGVMIGAGILLGSLGAWVASRSVAGLVEGVRPADPATSAAIVFLLAIAALLASVGPARRASRVDPLRALRQD